MDDHTRTLIVRARSKADRAAVDELFRRYRDPLRRALRKSLGPRYRLAIGGSEDAAHDAILTALGRIDQFEYRGDGSFLAWLLRAAQFEIANKIRRVNAEKRRGDRGESLETDPPADQTTASQAASKSELLDQVHACLEQLPPRERDVIELRRFLELSWAEVATELDMPTADSARALLNRAQARLAGLLSKRGLDGASS